MSRAPRRNPPGRPSRMSGPVRSAEQIGVGCQFRAAPFEVRRSDYLNRDLHEIRGELVRVMPAEDQLTTARKDDPQLAGRVTPVAALFGCGRRRGLRRWREGWGHR